jgi:hypothetical protein
MIKVLKTILLLFWLNFIFIPICQTQAVEEIKPPRIEANFKGVFIFSDTIIRIHDYQYNNHDRFWQRFTTIIMTNRLSDFHEIIKTNEISVYESDIYIFDHLPSRLLVLEALKANHQIEEYIFRYLYDNHRYTPDPTNENVIKKWKRRKKTAFWRYTIDDLKLAVFEVDCDLLNRFLNYSRKINCETRTVKIGFIVEDDFIEGK